MERYPINLEEQKTQGEHAKFLTDDYQSLVSNQELGGSNASFCNAVPLFQHSLTP